MARTSQEDLDKMSFGRAFNTRRDELGGSGKTFTWRGNKYTTNLAEEAPRRRGRTGPATENAPTESMRPRTRSSITENIPSRRNVIRDPRDESPTTRAPARKNVQRDGQDASPTTRARPPVRRDTQDMPPSISRVIDSAPNATARAEAQRIADEGMERRMPLRSLIQRIRDSISSRRQSATGDRAAARSEAAASAAAARRQAAQEARANRAGMAKGGLVKKGKTDRRGKGMFYDSKSPRGYK